MSALKKKRFLDTPVFGNTTAVFGMVIVLDVIGMTIPRAEASQAETCMLIYKGAEHIMQQRQSGIPLPEMLEMYKDLPALLPTVRETFQVSEMSLEKNKAQAVKEFAERNFSDCEREYAGH